jgi:choice-of-anchor B domain-containing protein
MMRLYGLLLLLCVSLFASAQTQIAYRFDLAGHWNDTSLASLSNPFSSARQTWSDLIGWTAPDGKEYVVMGSIDSIYFFDVSNPADIKKCGVYWGLNRAINRDFETYSHYVYCVSDNAPPGALQIFDLQYLPDSVHLIKNDSLLSSNTHSIFIDSLSKRLYFNSTQSYGPSAKHYAMEILSLVDPENPVKIGHLTSTPQVCGNVHEGYFRNDTAYCSCEFTGLHIFDVRDPDTSIYIGGVSPPYPYNGYNHTSWMDDSGKYLVFTDEVPYGLPIKLYDVSNKAAPDYKLFFNSHTGATPHNVIWIGNKLWTSAYEDGMVLYDMTNPLAPVVQGFYDTYHQNPDGVYDGLTGCWGVYPFFQSGYIAASDMRNGLFMLNYNQATGVSETSKNSLITKVFPNPFADDLNMAIYSNYREPAQVRVYSVSGQLQIQKQINLLEGENDIKLEEVSALKSGMYLLTIVSEHGITQMPVVKY